MISHSGEGHFICLYLYKHYGTLQNFLRDRSLPGIPDSCESWQVSWRHKDQFFLLQV